MDESSISKVVRKALGTNKKTIDAHFSGLDVHFGTDSDWTVLSAYRKRVVPLTSDGEACNVSFASRRSSSGHIEQEHLDHGLLVHHRSQGLRCGCASVDNMHWTQLEPSISVHCTAMAATWAGWHAAGGYWKTSYEPGNFISHN